MALHYQMPPNPPMGPPGCPCPYCTSAVAVQQAKSNVTTYEIFGEPLSKWLPKVAPMSHNHTYVVPRMPRGAPRVDVTWQSMRHTSGQPIWKAMKAEVYSGNSTFYATFYPTITDLSGYDLTSLTLSQLPPYQPLPYNPGGTLPNGPSYRRKQARGSKVEKVGAVRLWRSWNIAYGHFGLGSWYMDVDPKSPKNPDIRQWQHQFGHTLRSSSSGFIWKFEAAESHLIPGSTANEHVGFHGFEKWTASAVMGEGVMGAFLGWGTTVKHTIGMRTRFAQVDCILNHGVYEEEYLKKIADAYSVPLISREEAAKLPTFIEDFGTENIRKSDEAMLSELDE